ncbi:MAG TPA: hypothetical protein VLA15_06660, partial [Desulfurivibrionaceae bacterium]|nr:hypothetical protein [Desulfurivibrionaceae bacterium]
QIADEKIPVGRKASVKCPQCGEKIILSRPAPAVNPGISATPAEPVAPPPPGVEIPGREKQAGRPGKNTDYDYDFKIGEVLKEAWARTKGVKGPLWGALALILVVILGFSFVMGLVAGIMGNGGGTAISAALQITLSIAIYPLMAGVMMIGIRRAADLPISWKLAFGYFSYLLPIVICVFLTTILTTIGFILLIIPGIYLTLAYMLAIPLIIDKGMGPWQAMEASRRGITKHWFKIFGLYFVMGLIYLLGMIPLGLGLIWTMPMLVMVGGILYREIFGVSETA